MRWDLWKEVKVIDSVPLKGTLGTLASSSLYFPAETDVEKL